MKHINRRESPRVDIRLRCQITSPSSWPTDGMYTENISRNGLLIRWTSVQTRPPAPRIGQILTVEIELPAHHGFDRKCIHLQGTVVRVADIESESPNVALSVNYMDFRAFAGAFPAIRSFEPAARGWMA